ncbi:hypothetical protein C1646_669234 [Rhizophagus diaphanus]|nr:hypothetical protein C1646_669234 [Rhizophagus diaphanus] [Rhizophagus sp. MUCL 43196]
MFHFYSPLVFPFRIWLKWLRMFLLLHFLGNTFLELNFGLKTSASWIIWDIGFWLLKFFGILDFILWNIGFWLPGFFEILDFSFLGSLRYWILAFQILWNISCGFVLQFQQVFGALGYKFEETPFKKEQLLN